MASQRDTMSATTLVSIAPAPSRTEPFASETSAQQHMPYTCQTCSRRKVKCDKAKHTCSTCRKARLQCTYQAPPPRRKKRKLSDDMHEKVRRYEKVLLDNGLLEDADRSAGEQQDEETVRVPQPPPVSIRLNEPETARVGKLLSRSGRSRYIDSNLWRTIGDDELNQLSDEDDNSDEPEVQASNGTYISDPLTGALTAKHAMLLQHHPSYEIASSLWSLYKKNVDPICRVLHTPSVEPIFLQAARDPSHISKATECLLFAVYNFAIVSITDSQCFELMREHKPEVAARFRQAACHALVNAGFLRTGEMEILQAYILFLLATRTHYDPHTFWILSGIAWRIGQRMGLHRDGYILGLPPFEVQMRRRLFWQLLPMDGIAAQISGTGIAPPPDSWDTKQPLNLDESQIWPGMEQQPEEQVGATDMIFCIARTEIGKFHNKTALELKDRAGLRQSDPAAEGVRLEEQISAMEDLLERKFVRYCDIIEPLHFLTISLCRGAMVVLRLRLKVAMSKHLPVSKDSVREVHRLAMKVVDYDLSVHSNPAFTGYIWHLGAMFVQSALACALTSLRSCMFLTPDEIRDAWQKISQLMANHQEILDQKRALDVAMGRLILRAWDACSHTAGLENEPSFLNTLRYARRGDKAKKAAQSSDLNGVSTDHTLTDSTSPDSIALPPMLPLQDFEFNPDEFSIGSMDWMQWDQIMQDFQAKPFNVP